MHMDTECRPNSEEAKLRRGQTQKRPNSEEATLRSVRSRTRPRGPEQNQQREFISAQKTSHEHNNKDVRHLQ